MAVCVAWGTGCAGFLPAPDNYDYFAAPAASDAWSPKIGNWQRRARADRRSVVRRPRVAVAPVAKLPAVLAAEAPATALALSQSEPQPEPALPSRPLAKAPPVEPASIPAEPVIAPVRPEVETVATPGLDESLRQKYRAFQSEWRRAMVRDLFDWIQLQAQEHYFPDGVVDHWATLEETLERNGDDCDGLELLVYDTLLSLGFDKSEVFRAVVYRPADLQHHMVTLWFEDENDPWVIDPTGAMTERLVRMSELPDWVPLKLFGFHAEFTVGRLHQRGSDVAGPVAQN